VVELSAALEAERKRGELVTMALDHAQHRLEEAYLKLDRGKKDNKEKEKVVKGLPGASRAQVVSGGVLQCGAVWCRILQGVAEWCRVVPCVVVCCSVL